jgi:DNA-binding response OmpR family regulator
VKNDGGPVTRVLVVEDEVNIRELVCLHLRHEGYVCDDVGDGNAGLERHGHPDTTCWCST